MKQLKILIPISIFTLFTTYSHAVPVNMAPIISYLLSDTATATPQEIAIDKIEAYADNQANPVPTLQDYSDAGVTGVTVESIDDVNSVVASLTASDVDSLAEIQAVVDSVTPRERYIRDDANGIVTDTSTGLQWQDNESIQKPWLTQENYDAADYYNTTGDTAATYCSTTLSTFDGGGWRLPSIYELEGIVEGTVTPRINEIFVNSAGSYYWSSTTFEGLTLGAWTVSFSSGNSNFYNKSFDSSVRCVRAVQ